METVEHFVEKFIPENYNIFLDINRKERIFSGNVAISGEALDNTISFHQKDLAITAILLDNAPLVFEMDQANEAVHVQLLETGSMTLVLEFSGRITDNMTGMYPSYYTIDGLQKEIISTQFESHFAREVFPSIDEPEAKATFNLSLKFDQEAGEVAIANMPEINVDLRQETGLWTFETTPRMSSYLLAFALGDLQGATAKTQRGTEVGVFATKAHSAQSLTFALDFAVRLIDFYEDYYGISYPLPQSYHLALPDFSAGAMENWGLVTYREIYLLVDENSTVKSRQNVALVIAHELAHQWFGNLVTMKWWDDLWLNESFANMMEYVAIDALEPTWNIFEDFQTTGVPLALKRDATDGVQSVHVEVHHPDEINTLFDPAIVYAKGSRLMHMLRRWLGDEQFAAGLNSYFDRHQYSNTVGRDLWEALTETSGRDVAGFMDAWLEQPGYPLLTAEVIDDSLVLSQKQFFIGQHQDKGRIWPIPLNSNWQGLPDTLTEERIEIPHFKALAAQNEGALRFNTGNTAHYLTNYKGELLTELVEQLTTLETHTKLQLIQERRLLAESGEVSYAELIPLLTQLTDERSYLVASAIDQVLSGLEKFIDEGSQTENDFKTLIEKISWQNYVRLGFEPKETDTDEDELVRQLTVSQILRADNPDAVAKAKDIFAAHSDKLETIPASIRLSVLINQMKTAETQDLADGYLQAYRQTNDGHFKHQLAVAFSYTKSQATVERILSELKNKNLIKPQDLAISWYNPFLNKDFTQGLFWLWARENWDWIKTALGGDMSFDKFVIYPANHFKTQERLEEYRGFFEPQLGDLSISRNISLGIKEISARIVLIDKERFAVEQAIQAAR
ncbi:M1 family metallopeptidase [Streptococcus sp. H31]|uniref:M1 family metallopeptidase n=1 Tax=Streptococcus huangxiaojuni TaxID=3237239 RepID=UPI0034A52138